jgi:parallel beta-helix repeat protein
VSKAINNHDYLNFQSTAFQDMLIESIKLFSLTRDVYPYFVVLMFIAIIYSLGAIFGQTQGLSSCISYDATDMIISVSCKSASLRDIREQMNDPGVLSIENDDRIWRLNAGIVVEEGATLYINSSDVTWLKILSKNNNGDKEENKETSKTNIIEVHGSLKIDSIKLTSWDAPTNDYVRNPGSRDLSDNHLELGTPRPHISIESDATGTTDITNSELAYLGYEGGVGAGPDDGITYFGGDGSTLKNNNIHHLYFGFYSNGVGHITIESNAIHHNAHYGLDPHTGTHDMIIRNNEVYENGGIGIICSLDCFNIIIENNKVYNNTKMGIMFSRNMYDSIARNNIINHEDNGIVISESHDNQIYNNVVSHSGRGIDLDKESYDNVIRSNVIRNIPDGDDALHIEDGAADVNTVHSNKIINSNNEILSVNHSKDEVNESEDENELKELKQSPSTKPPPLEHRNNDPFSNLIG